MAYSKNAWELDEALLVFVASGDVDVIAASRCVVAASTSTVSSSSRHADVEEVVEVDDVEEVVEAVQNRHSEAVMLGSTSQKLDSSPTHVGTQASGVPEACSSQTIVHASAWNQRCITGTEGDILSRRKQCMRGKSGSVYPLSIGDGLIYA